MDDAGGGDSEESSLDHRHGANFLETQVKLCAAIPTKLFYLTFPSHRRQFSLNEQQFHDYLKTLCNEKQLDLEEMQSKLLSVGPPPSPSPDDSL